MCCSLEHRPSGGDQWKCRSGTALVLGDRAPGKSNQSEPGFGAAVCSFTLRGALV